MMRSVLIFSFFALATVLVIVLQPGPRPDYAFQPVQNTPHEASRNEVGVLHQPQANPALQAPDDVIAKLKAAAEPQRVQAGEEQSLEGTAGSLQRLQAALNASLGTPDVRSDAPAVTAPSVETPARVQQAMPAYSVAPELRDMSWQTLNALNGLNREAKAPGQEGSLLNSIVRRSMGRVGDAPMVQARAPQAQAVRDVPQQQPFVQGGAKQSYTVAPGDTLALIAIKLYGSALEGERLLSDNPELRQNPNALRIGQVLQYSLN